ncbi:SoxR reducing system RseC family protein [Sideroxydans lithotrophicus]|uniref:Positive regulator of sigma E, RseC/MucC n=1 Tax=Sideroxydans lithotrophicus (strain ES-1) TaxID=580332 RepID=D5CRC8_SIDLE|nr:SoxR reducing system RseC family protein [Sideroxydans lithotrophicus]ADE11514.1 positive regulator of sigma E, RseC/MucC [Sideroxydans lithotrophicus ES-1]
MLEMRAIVIHVHGDSASVKPLGTGGCGHCDSEGGCGSGTLTKLFCSNKPRLFNVSNAARAMEGDEVEVTIPDGALLRGAMKMYVVPMVLLLVGGAAGSGLATATVGHDAYAVVGALFGLAIGFIYAKLSPGIGQAVASSVVRSQSGH